MAFILTALNHFKMIQSWAQKVGASASLDMLTFEAELKASHRFYRLRPQFFCIVDGQPKHSASLNSETTGFIGWLPYRPVAWDLAIDKVAFKRLITNVGQATPDSWNPAEPPPVDYVLKRSWGSFGNELLGPYSSGSRPPQDVFEKFATAVNLPLSSTLFAEQFVAGDNLKIWVWGSELFYAHLHPYPAVTGNGRSTAHELVVERLSSVNLSFDDSPDCMAIRRALVYQGFALHDVPPLGRSVWLDFRYGRQYAKRAFTEATDNALPKLTPAVHAQAMRIATLLGDEVRKELGAPVLFSVDGVLDAHGKVWWLEMNSNPALPPAGYPLIFRDLFGIEPGAADDLKPVRSAAPELSTP